MSSSLLLWIWDVECGMRDAGCGMQDMGGGMCAGDGAG